METLFVVVAIFVVLQFSSWFNRFIKIASYTYQIPYVFPMRASNIPEAHRSFFRKTYLPLQVLGFKHCGFIQQRSLEKNADARVYIAAFFHEESRSFAWLHQAILNPSVADPLVLYFITPISNGKLIVTDNQHIPCSPVEHASLVEYSISCENAEALWEAHTKHLETEGVHQSHGCDLLTPAEMVARFNNAWDSDFESELKKGTLSGETNGYFISLKNAWTLLRQFVSRHKATMANLAKRNASSEKGERDFSRLLENEDLLAPQANVASLLIAEQNIPTRRIFAWVNLVVSIVLFAIFFGVWLGWEIVPILILVLLFHELGHFYAMRLSGYSQTSIFFIPGLGAAASGRAQNANYWQRMGVFLAGPIPGILLAFALWIFVPDPQPWLSGAITVLLIINWINLLPFMPLDGGQVINLCLGERSRMVFGWISGVGLIFLAWAFAEPVLWILGAYGLFAAFSRQTQFRLRVRLGDLAKTASTETEFINQALKSMQAPAYNATNFHSRVQLIREYLEEMHMPKVRFVEKIFGLVVYVLSILLPLWLFAVLIFSSEIGDWSAEVPDRNWQLELEQTSSAYDSMEVALDAIEFHLEYYDLEAAEHFVSEAQSFVGQEAITSQQVSELQGADLQLWFLTFEDHSYEEAATRVEAYLALSPSRNENWYDLMRLSVHYLDPETELINQILASLRDYLENQGEFSELANLYLQMSYLTYGTRVENTAPILLEDAVRFAPDEEKFDYKAQLASAYVDQGDYTKAWETFEEIKDQDLAAYMLNRDAYAWAAFKLGNYEQSIRIYEEGLDAIRTDGNIPILSWFVDRSHEDYAEFNVRLNQLVVAQAGGDQREIDRIGRLVMKLSNTLGAGVVEDLRSGMEVQLEYQEGWYADSARERLKTLNRIHPKN